MKTTAPLIALAIGAILLPLISLGQQEKTSLDIFKMTSIPKGQYEVNLQLQGKDHQLTVQVDEQRIRTLKTTNPALQGLEGPFELIGNGVFLVRLKNPNMAASQFWLFQPDGTAIIKEIPDRGEQQKAVPAPAGNQQN
jgi:hypothetical protein